MGGRRREPGGRGPLGPEDQGRRGGCFPLQLGPQEACWAPGPGLPFSGAPSGLVGPRGWERGKRGEEEERQMVWGAPPGLEDHRKRGRRFSHPFGPRKAAGLPDWVLHPPRPPPGCVGPRGVGGRWGALWDWRIRGGTEGVSPTHSAREAC